MSKKMPISVHVLTWNSGRTLRRALDSVRECEEILVIDGGSTDATLQIAAEFGAKVIAQPNTGAIIDFSAVRNRGFEAATRNWILSLDSDETASPELLREIEGIIRTGTPCACFVPRRYLLLDGSIVRYASTYPNERLYFFHRDAVTKWIKPVHERPQVKRDMPIVHLEGASLAPLGSIEDYRRKNLRYLDIEREQSHGETLSHWIRHRLLRTIRTRIIATLRLLWIWLLPHRGRRLPLRHELLRYWYAWRLVTSTFPKKRS